MYDTLIRLVSKAGYHVQVSAGWNGVIYSRRIWCSISHHINFVFHFYSICCIYLVSCIYFRLEVYTKPSLHDALIVTLSEIPNHVCGGMCQLDGVLVLMFGVAYMKADSIQPMCGGPGAGACRYNNRRGY